MRVGASHFQSRILSVVSAKERERSPVSHGGPKGPAELTPKGAFDLGEVCEALGLRDPYLAKEFLAQVQAVSWPHSLAQTKECEVAGSDAVKQALAVLRGVGPSDTLEAMLAIQMFATHSLSMRLATHAMPCDNIKVLDVYLRHFERLAGLHVRQLEALQRYRHKGQQKVTVEHVHVHQGGQAVVGEVHSGRGGG